MDDAFWSLTKETKKVRGEGGALREEPLLMQARDGRWMLSRAYASERYTVQTVRHEEGTVSPVATAERLGEIQHRLEQQASGSAPLRFSAEQRHAALLVTTSPSRYVHIQGDAGSGKTTVVRLIGETAIAEGFIVKGLAVTGNAAKELADAAGIETKTVARFILGAREQSKLMRRFDAIDEGNHPRKTEVWIVDEASMLGQVDFARLVHYAEESKARVVFVGDRRQLPAVPAGKPWELVQDHGGPRAELRENIRQRDPGEREAVDRVKRREYSGALQKLFELGKVVVDASPVELVSRLAKEWQAQARAGDRPLIGVVTHRARSAVNEAIRRERMAAGEIDGRGMRVTILESLQWTRAQMRSVVSYADANEPLRVRFRRDYRSLGIKAGEYGVVREVNERADRIALDVNGRQIMWQPARHTEIEVYREGTREIARGDAIVITRDHPSLGNRGQWEVSNLEPHRGTVTVTRTSTGRVESFNLDAMPHWDYAYARTLHGLQGTTANRFMLYVESNHPYGAPGKVSDRVLEDIFGARGFYVGVTRQRSALAIYTNDRELLARSIMREREKTSGIEGMRPPLGRER